ncbi:MAG: YhcN/YlaJ family sporulation lipoprotein [Bacillus sp. (in: firmicutes)]
MKKAKWFMSCLAVLVSTNLLLSGCTDFNKTGEAKMALFKTVNPHPAVLKETPEEFALAEKIHSHVLSYPEIYDAAIITNEKKVLVAYKVKQMKRFSMKKIEKKLKKDLEKKFKDEDRQFTVSSDYKIFLEAVELNEKLKDKSYSRKKGEKDFKNIIKLQKEMT